MIKESNNNEYSGSFVKRIKGIFYRVKAKDFHKMLALMIVGGIFASIVYTVKYQYIEYAASQAHVSLVYPEIADGEYPDGSRFTYYDLINEERVQEALDIMQSRGKYKYFTAKQLCDRFHIYSYLEESVTSSVSSMRSAGNDYSYVANEYDIMFPQPHDYKNPDFISKFFTPDDSAEFLTELMNVNSRYFQAHYGGAGGFAKMTEIADKKGYDYAELVSIYKTRLSTIITYLNGINDKAGGFVSETTGKNFKDIINLYNVLYSERLDQIANYVDASGLTSDIEVMNNKINVNIETNTLKYNKLSDESEINNYAKNAYDHTFTENLIVVATDNNNGLYQARPKTIFDTIAEQYHTSKNAAVECGVKINKLHSDKANYSAAASETEEYKRLNVKCSEMLEKFSNDYNELCAVAEDTVRDYYMADNESYLIFKIKPQSKIPMRFLLKFMISFVLGMAVMFIVYITLTSMRTRRRLKKKRRLLNSMRMNRYRF